MRQHLREWREWMPVAFLGVVLTYALVASVIITFRITQVDHALVAQQQSDHQALVRHEALLKRVEADEQRVCAAAKTAVQQDGGTDSLVTILCPKGN